MTDIGGQISMEWRKELFRLRSKMQKTHFGGSAEEYFKHYAEESFVQEPTDLGEAIEELQWLRSIFPTQVDDEVMNDPPFIPEGKQPKSRAKDFGQSPGRFKQ